MLKERSAEWKRRVPLSICRHHWVIEPANGPTSQGECRKCGRQKTFQNIVSELPWSERLAPVEKPHGPILMELTPVPEAYQGQGADEVVISQGGFLI